MANVRRLDLLRVKNLISKIILALAILLVAFVVVLTPDCYRAYTDRNVLVAYIIVRLVTPVFALVSLLFVTVPSFMFYRQDRRRRDLWSFWMSLAALALMVAEAFCLGSVEA